MSNIVKVLQTWAQKQAQHNAVLFLEDGEQETASLTYAELDHKAKAIAALLQAHELQNQRVLLVYPTGVEFIASLIGCWYAGAIAVPLSCPKLEDLSKQRTLFNTLSEDADVAAVLALDSYRGPLKKLIKRKIIACATDKISPKMAENVQPTKITDKTIAYLQYTSGSTSAPKAATISHGNLQQNIRDTIDAWHYDQNSVTVNWAPHTHVYGLVCGLLVPLYHGTPAIIMPPAVFINKPSLWLRALSKYQGTHGGCPNFGYDLCVRHVLENEVSELDLQHWQVAVNGGDMVQARTLNAFVEKFSACGFALKHFSSAYGMSEVSGAIAVTPFGTEPEEFIDADQRRLISSGKLLSGFQALAVDPESKTALPEGEVGEIWLHGKSVISGYWQRPEENQEVFDVQVADSKLRYFRTGDLGFIRDQQIYLTGRLKEVMVIYGKKYYPLDLEMTVAKNLVPWEINLPQVAFSLEIAGKEQIIIAQELNHYSNEQGQQLSDLIRHAITKAHGVDVHEVIFSPPGSIPKTASGKLQRKRAQLLFKEGQFARFAQEEIKQTTQQLPSHEPFVQLVADVLNIDPKHIDLEAPLSRYAFDSVNMIHFTNRINETYGLNLSPAALYEFTSLAAFYVDHIQSQNTPVVQTKNDTVIQQECNDIAIIGMSGIFPQAADLDDFWNNLALGKDCISELPRARWNTEEFAVQWGGFIDHVDQFDAAFFNISPREAELIDPQQRLFLQTVWKTIEDSGYAPDAIAAVKTGLFVGVFNHDYAELLQQQGVMDAYLTTGTMNSMIANRISYVLNLRGPSEAIDTACSSSLVAIHQAVSAILQGDCELAIAGGVNILSSATSFNSANQAGMLSQDGRCKTFDKDANGYVRGEGVGAILLKKLSQALTDGDQIHGVIKGTAVNHGGHVNTLTAPNPNAQAEVIVSACQRAQIPVESIQYIETHGTGTPLGDPIEINGLKKAFQQLALVQEKKDLGKNYCALGAVKTHIGHLESAAGIAGLIKMLLALRHQTLPANLHLNTVNPYIDITDSPFYLLDKSYPWPKGQTTPRRAGISSFGFGGANAHIVIEEAPASEKRADYPHQDYLICLSAQTEIALEQRKKDLHTWLTQQNSSPCLATLSYTLNVGRQHFAQRFAVIVSSVEELLTALAAGENSTINSTSALQVFGQKYRQGEAIAWQSIYGDFQQRMSLPTYPFAKDSHWIAQKAQRLGRLHALLDANQSTLNQVLFSKRFQGNEFYLQEHQVHQEKVLPGALCLEMAYVAANLALKNQPVRAMSQIIWQKPIKSFELQHTLELQLTAAGQDVAFSLGYAQEQFVSGRIHYSSATPLFHLNKVSEFPKQQSPEAIYAYFKKAGLNYGASFQVIKQLQYNDTQLLAELELAENIAIEGYQLHPCLLDGVLQCTQALLKNRQNLYLPFSINHLTLHAPLTRSCQVWVHLSSAPDEEAFPTFNIQVTDLEGKSLLDIHEFTLAAVVNETVSTAYYQPQWVAQAPQADSSMLGKVLVLASQQNQLERLHKELGLEQADYALLEQFTDIPEIIILEAGELQAFHQIITRIIQLKPQQPVQIIVITKETSSLTRALVAYGKTLEQEHNKFSFRLIETTNYALISAELAQRERQVRYEDSQRQVLTYAAVDLKTMTPILKQGGVYLITGGLGGLGLLFASFLARNYQAQLILVGRSALAKPQKQKIAELESSGALVTYMQVDIANSAEVNSLIAQIKVKHGQLQGVIHAAGLTHDAFIMKKQSKEIEQVLAPKIQGTLNLHQATLNEPLDFFVLFSSVASIFGNAGQSDYAYANAFLDDFAQVREQDRQAGKCFGKTLSINWPLWEEGGITVAAEYQQTLERQLGIVSLTTAEGLTAFVAALNSDLAQCIVLPGRQTKLKQSLREAAQIKNHKVPKIVNVDPQLREQISQLLTQTIAATLKIAPEKLDKQVSFEHYGIDSLMIIQLNQALEKEFKDLPKTLFFEYQNLADLIDYFVSEHAPTFKPISTPTLVMNNQDIAIIGIDGRYPEAENLAQFWENLKIGKDCIREIPAERWDWTHYFSTQKASGKTYSKWGGFLKHVDHFDPLFFNISPSEAALMDPQERLFLQTAWNTIEDAGLSRTQLAGQKVGVYVGVMYGQYQLFAQDHAFVPTNSVYASIANRVSYFFDFHGPSMALDTMCSSSLTAIHLACKSIQNGECQLALAGGVNLCLHPNKYLLLSEGSFLASDGHCRSFGEGGDGYVPGEGVGAVLLKPLAQALADGDRIYAVIKGSQLNHGGKTNGYTVPNPNAQAQLIASTYQQAQVNPAELSYLEAHGTGTSLGDPIEIAGLNKAFAAHGLQHCAIGSVKANIGHCESAAGIAAVTKVVLQLQHKMLVPSIGSDTLNRNIQWEQTPFKVQQQLSPWQGTRISGISSFGAGGANAHLILSEAPNNVKPYANKSHYLCTLSAKTDWALAQKKRDLVQWIKQNPQAHLESVSYTLNAGRTHFPQRAAWVVSSLTELLEQLESNQQLFAETSLNQLAQAYLAGQDLDWQQLHAQEAKIKIALPTYPFAKESYWFNQLEEEIIENELTSVTSPLNDKLEAYLTRQVVQLLKVKAHQLDPSKNLGEYGMDSVHFVELAQSIAKEYQIDFTPAVFYTSSSIRTISQTLAEQYGEAVAKVHQTAFSLPMVTQIAHKKFAIPSEMNEAIAIIGIQGTFPQSADVHQFWENLSANKDLVSEVPADRWDWRQYYGTGPHQSNTKWGGFIAEMDQFDAAFFNISAREAHLMDPQQRLFLQSVWQSIEDAGYNPLDLSGKKVAVFAGVEFNEYQTLIAKQGTEHHGFIATGSSHSMIANRVSYFFNFHGPSEAIDTACSSSLVAIHRAMQALRQGECELAIAGGISLMLDPETTVVTSQLGALSAEGRCKTFDKSANGYVKGEGVGSLLLKPLKQAQRDGDSIYAVIRGSAVNHGGKAQSLTAPNAAMQAELLLSAYTQAQIPPESISYIEAHGTGTALGDPVEIEGLKLAFKTLLGSQYEQSRIGLGSVKTNIGHLEPASGIAGVIKLLLAMTHETLPAIQHLQELNPFINLENSPFYIVKEKQAWQRQQEKPLRAGVSSFGFGGTNAHVVLEEGRPHQQLKTEQQLRPYYLITLSAKQAESLEQKIKDLLQWLPTQDNLCLASLSYTLNQGRAHFAYRCALVVSSIAELIQALTQLSNDETPDYCLLNEGQSCSMQGPVFAEIYEAAMQVVMHPQSNEQYRQKLFVLADLYTKQYPLDWPLLYQGGQPQRLAGLPAYPFNKQRYWFDLQLTTTPVSQVITSTARTMPTDLPGSVMHYLRGVFAEKLRTVPETIQVDETYEVYGVDSIIGLEITNRLEQDFGTLPKTLLYERNQIKDLAQYFIKQHKDKVATLITAVPAVDALPAITIEAPKANPMPVLLPQTSQDIAIIGLHGTFPMANTMDEFWDNLVHGRDCVGEVPADRWNYKDYPVQIGTEEKYFPHGGFIPDVDKFDPLFFNISPRDASFMDPQERLFMQSVWSTLEDAGYTREKLKVKTNNEVGVFAGVTYNFYPIFIAEEWQKGNRVPLDVQSFSVANRISYFLNLQGPSLVVDTACSSSLAAIHLACDSILRGDCRMAIAGGVNLSLHPSKYHFLGSFSFMSDVGRCTSFAEGGTGYVPSEGVGAVLLKPLAEAIADNDHIYGVIKASSMNHGGKTSGYTVPNPNAQADVILKTLNKAKIDARSISYIEAHGTGTALGDPIEVRGLQEAFEQFTEEKQYCAIGSVKSNLGHLESAAGISQLAKVLLQMQHKQLVPSIHAEKLNPFIDFANSPFYVQRELSAWQPTQQAPRRAGVSSFGAGGANVHMIIEEYVPAVKSQATTQGPFIFVLSALNEDRLQAQLAQMRIYLQNGPDELSWLQNACYSLQIGREAMTARLAVVAKNKAELLQFLAAYPQSSNQLWINLQAQAVPASADLGQWLQTKQYEKLAEHWVKGMKIDWEQLYAQKPQLISLPTYPFAKRRCWIPTKEVEVAPKPVVDAAPIAAIPSFNADEWLYAMEWEKQGLSQSTVPQLSEGPWLIISDKEFGLVVQDQLGAESSICFAAADYLQFNDQVFYANLNRQADYEKVLAAQGKNLQGIIYLSSAVNPEQQDPTESLLALFKAMIIHCLHKPLRFALVTHSAQAVQATDNINYWQHHLWSMTRIFAAEQAHCQAVLLDLDAKASHQLNAQQVVAELSQIQATQNHLAYRRNERYSIRFKTAQATTTTPWKAPVAALITGGLGALGYEVAEYLLAQGTQYLLLTGTSALTADTKEKNTWLQQLQRKKVQVIYAAVDVADKAAMQKVIQDTEKTWQKSIDGVFHLAGITTDNITIADMDEALWRKVLDVKVKGSLVLHELFLKQTLTSFVLFSSIACVPHFGMSGLSAYAVANEFMSGLALYRRSQQLPAVSMNWVAWSEKGMSHRHNHDAFLDAVGMASLTIKEGIQVMDRVLQLNPAEITLCKLYWQKFLQINASAKQLDFFSHFTAQYGQQKAVISQVAAEDIAPLVLKLFAKSLQLQDDEVDEDTPFQQYGMDSIVGIHFTADLDKHFPDAVSPMDLYRYPSLKQLSDYIRQQVQTQPAQAAELSEENVQIDTLSYDQLNELIEAELKELELTYE